MQFGKGDCGICINEFDLTLDVHDDKIQRMRSWRWLVKYFQLNFRSKWVVVDVEVEVEVPNLVNLAWRWSLTTGELRQRIIELRLSRRPQILSINYCAGPRIQQTNRIHSFHDTATCKHTKTKVLHGITSANARFFDEHWTFDGITNNRWF